MIRISAITLVWHFMSFFLLFNSNKKTASSKEKETTSYRNDLFIVLFEIQLNSFVFNFFYNFRIQ